MEDNWLLEYIGILCDNCVLHAMSLLYSNVVLLVIQQLQLLWILKKSKLDPEIESDFFIETVYNDIIVGK